MISTPGRTPAATNVDWTGRAAASETPLAKSRLSAASRRSARRSAARNPSHAIKDPRDVTHNELVAKLGDPEADHVIGHRFLFVKRLGQGSYGYVVQAMDRCTGREVAIKVIAKAKANPVLPRRHTEGTEPAEFALTRRCRHPNVVEVYEWAESDLSVFLVMELVRGDALVDYLEAQPELLTEQQAMLIVWQLLAALAHLARNHVVHRDIKPHNIMIDIESHGLPVIKLVDFGLATDLLAVPSTAAANDSTYSNAAANDDDNMALTSTPIAIAEPPAVVAAASDPISESAADSIETTSPDAPLATIGAQLNAPSHAPITLAPATVRVQFDTTPAALEPAVPLSGGKGSLDWMAPESVSPAWHVPGYSTRIDTWAVGAVLFWLTVEFAPFCGYCEEEGEGNEKAGESRESKGEFKEVDGASGLLEAVAKEGVDLDANVLHGVESALDGVAPLDAEQLAEGMLAMVENNEAVVMPGVVEDNEAVCDLSRVAAQEQVYHVESESGAREEEPRASEQVGDKDAANDEQEPAAQPKSKAELDAEVAAELEAYRKAVIRRICTVDYPRRVFFEPGDGSKYDFFDERPIARRLIAALLILDPRDRPSASDVLGGSWFVDVKTEYGELYHEYCEQFDARHNESPVKCVNASVDLNVATPTPPPPMPTEIPVVFFFPPPASPLASAPTFGAPSPPSTIATTHASSSPFSVVFPATPTRPAAGSNSSSAAGAFSVLSTAQFDSERILGIVHSAMCLPKSVHITHDTDVVCSPNMVDLTTIEDRIRQHVYPHVGAFYADLDAMVAFHLERDNGIESESVMQARHVRQLLRTRVQSAVDSINKRQRVASAGAPKEVGGGGDELGEDDEYVALDGQRKRKRG